MERGWGLRRDRAEDIVLPPPGRNFGACEGGKPGRTLPSRESRDEGGVLWPGRWEVGSLPYSISQCREQYYRALELYRTVRYKQIFYVITRRTNDEDVFQCRITTAARVEWCLHHGRVSSERLEAPVGAAFVSFLTTPEGGLVSYTPHLLQAPPRR